MQDKPLQNMTLKELWQLFPVTLVPHNPEWKDWARKEMAHLSALFSGYSPVITHIGSTAVPDILSKPIVDILVEVPVGIDWCHVKNIMESNDYICMAESDRRISFNKGYTLSGYAEKVFHIHFHRAGDNLEILFRNYLIASPETAKEYERLKLSLLPEFRHDRDGYTEAKTDFVRRIVADALRSNSRNKLN